MSFFPVARAQTREEASQPLELWLLPIRHQDAPAVLSCLARLPSVERARADRLLVRGAREEFVLGRALLRFALSRRLPVPPGAWVLQNGPHGKPYVKAPACAAEIRFNLSHTHGLVACAVGLGPEIGVDVEHMRIDLDLRSLTSHIFAPIELAKFELLTGEAAHDYFYSIWTLKEAYIKACGTGLSSPLDTLHFELGDVDAQVEFSDHRDEDSSQWQFIRFEPMPAYKLALAQRGREIRPVKIHWMTAEQLVSVVS